MVQYSGVHTFEVTQILLKGASQYFLFFSFRFLLHPKLPNLTMCKIFYVVSSFKCSLLTFTSTIESAKYMHVLNNKSMLWSPTRLRISNSKQNNRYYSYHAYNN